MKQCCKIILSVISCIFCFFSNAGESSEQAYPPTKIPEEIRQYIPENIDYIGIVNGNSLPVIFMKKNIVREMKKHFYLQKIKFPDVLNRYYIFGSTEKGYCGILIFSSDQRAKRLYQSFTERMKEKDKSADVTDEFAVSIKEKLFFKLCSDDILLISIDETDPERYVSKNPAPIFNKIETSNIAELYCKGNPKKIPIIREYIANVPDIPGFKEVRMVFKVLTMTLNADFVFPSQKEAEETLLRLDKIQEKIALIYPDFSSTYNWQLCNKTITFTCLNSFFNAVKRIIKDPEYKNLFQKNNKNQIAL